MNKKENKLNNVFWLVPFFITAALAIVIFSLCNRMIGGEYTFVHSDCMQQYVPAMKMFWRGIFNGEGIVYSFDFSLGSPTIPLYAFYSCFSPISIVFGLINDGNVATMVVVVIKLALAGGFFYIFVDRLSSIGRVEKCIFSVLYGLSGYFIIFFFNFIFLDGAYMLPIIMLLLHKLYTDKKWVLLSICYGYIFIVNFYEGYIIGLFSFVVLLTYCLVDYHKQWKETISRIIRLAVSGVIGLMLSAVVLLPTFSYVLNNQSSELNSFGGLKLTLLDVIGNMFVGQMQSVDSIYPFIYCGLITMILVIFFFVSKKVEVTSKIKGGVIFGFLILCCIISPLYLMMHAFNAPDSFGFRFAYLISFVMLFMGVKCFEKCKDTFREEILKLAVIVAGAFCIYYLSYLIQRVRLNPAFVSVSNVTLIINAVFLVVYCGYFYLIRSTYKSKTKNCIRVAFGIIVCIELVINGYMTASRVAYVLPDIKASYEDKNNEAYEALSRIEEMSDDEFYRVKYDNVLCNNYSQLYGYHGLGSFSSIENPYLHETLGKLGYETSPGLMIDYGSTLVTRMLFGQKYTINGYHPSNSSNYSEPLVSINDNTLSLGYMVSENILYHEFYSDNPFFNQNWLINAMLGHEVTLWSGEGIELNAEAYNTIMDISPDGYEDRGNFVIVVDEGREGSFSYYATSDADNMYGYLEVNESRDQSGTSPYLISVNGDMGDWAATSKAGTPHITKLGRGEDGKYDFTFVFNETTDDAVFFNDIDIKYINSDVLEQVYEELSQCQLNVIKVQGGYIKGSIDIADANDKILMTTIPYDSNWKIYDNGMEMDTIPLCNNTFLGVELSEGSHELEFIYNAREVKIGALISLAAILMIVIYVMVNRRHKKRTDASE